MRRIPRKFRLWSTYSATALTAPFRYHEGTDWDGMGTRWYIGGSDAGFYSALSVLRATALQREESEIEIDPGPFSAGRTQDRGHARRAPRGS